MLFLVLVLVGEAEKTVEWDVALEGVSRLGVGALVVMMVVGTGTAAAAAAEELSFGSGCDLGVVRTMVSGGKYPGVPIPTVRAEAVCLERPKSMSLTCPRHSMMFSGLMSRWTRPEAWR